MTNIVLKTVFGFMEPAQFIEFLDSPLAGAAEAAAPTTGIGLAIALAFLGGLAMNLTPCVLPMIPVNLSIIGRTFSRGLAYATGQALTCGVLGLVAALGGVAFGALNGNRAFNLAAAILLFLLALCLLDVLNLDLSRSSNRLGRLVQPLGLFGVFLAGGISALLAGACVAPAVAVMLVMTANGVAAGNTAFAALPFAFGIGMGFPWPFIAAGIGKLPKPGAWMIWLKRGLGVLVLLLAATYGLRGIRPAPTTMEVTTNVAIEDTGKPVLYKVGAPWCVYCHKMDATTLKDPAVIEALSRYDVRPVEINDFSELQDHPILKDAQIVGVPAYIIVTPAK